MNTNLSSLGDHAASAWPDAMAAHQAPPTNALHLEASLAQRGDATAAQRSEISAAQRSEISAAQRGELSAAQRGELSAAQRAGAAAALSAACLSTVLDELDSGVLLCNADGRVLLANAAAQRELTQGALLHLGAESALAAAPGVDLASLRRAVHSAAQRGLRRLVPLRNGAHSLVVGVLPMPAEGGAGPAALLLLGRRQVCPDLAVQMLGQLYELTSAECSVLSSLLAGVRIPLLARDRGVAVSTIRTQVAAIRGKFGVRRMDDLMRMVAEMPSMMSALRRPGGPAAASGASAVAELRH